MNKGKENTNYDNLSQAINGLRKQGYVEDLNLKPYCLERASSKLELHPEDFQVDAFYRCEGMSNPDDGSIIYALSGKGGIKGKLVDASYGAYSESLSEAMIHKLKVSH